MLLRGDREEQVERAIQQTCLGRGPDSPTSSDFGRLVHAAQNDLELKECGLENFKMVVESEAKSTSDWGISSLEISSTGKTIYCSALTVSKTRFYCNEQMFRKNFNRFLRFFFLFVEFTFFNSKRAPNNDVYEEYVR